jgi:hypothetical protein
VTDMQQIKGILLVDSGRGRWVDAYGKETQAPIVTLGVMARLVIDLRSPFEGIDDDILPPYPISEFSGLGLYFAMDVDYDKETVPPITRSSGITVANVDGKTILDIPLPDTGIAAIEAIIKKSPETGFKNELIGLNAELKAALSIEMPLGMKNRVWRPELQGEEPEPPPVEDPEWLAAVTAIIEGKVQDAVDQIEVKDGVSSHTYIGYASDAQGTGFSLTPTSGLHFRAEIVSSETIATPALADFQAAGAEFYRYIFPGEKGDAMRLYIGYASDAEGTDFSLAASASRRYRAEFASSDVIETPTLADFQAAGAVFVKYLSEDGKDGSGFRHRGPWNSSETYAKNDLVLYKGGWLLSLIDGNATMPPAPPASNDQWQTIVTSGANGRGIAIAYSKTGDNEGTDWHSVMSAGDKYYRISSDGGVNWSIPRLLSLPPVGLKIQFTAAESPTSPVWNELAYSPENDFSTAAGVAYFRFKMAGSVWSDGRLLIGLGDSATTEEIAEAEALLRESPLMVQFSSEGQEDSEWHGTILEDDRYVRFYNGTGTVRVVWDLSGFDVELEAVQVSATGGHWHDQVQAGDCYMRLSLDGGATFMSPWPFRGKEGKSAYQVWLDQGNTGAPEEFLDSLKGKDGDDGKPGEGLRIDQADTFERRHLCDSAPQGFIFLATDILVDDAEREYQAFYIKRTVAQGDWSDPVRLYPGSPGKTGAAGTVDIGEVSAGIAPEVRNSGTPSAAVLDFVLPVGPPGPGAVPVPDYEFTHADIVGGGLTISGVNPIAAVELYDAEGNGISIERGDAAGTDKCMVRTCYPENHTVVYFGTGLDTTHGGRVRFAQGLSGASLFQIWKANYGNELSTEADYLEWLRGQNSWLDFTDADVTDGVAFLPVTVPVVSVVTSNGNCYPVEKGCLTPAVGGWNLNLAPYLAYDNAPAFAGTWKVGLAAGTVASIVIHQGSAPNGVYQPRLANGNLHYLSLTRDTTILAPVRLRSNETLAVEVLTNRHYVTVKGKRFSGTRLLVTFWQGFAGARATVDSIL